MLHSTLLVSVHTSSTRNQRLALLSGTASDAYVFSGEHYARWDFIRDEVLEVGKMSDAALFAPVIENLGVCVPVSL